METFRDLARERDRFRAAFLRLENEKVIRLT